MCRGLSNKLAGQGGLKRFEATALLTDTAQGAGAIIVRKAKRLKRLNICN